MPDLRAGLTVALVSIPEGMAYALVAGASGVEYVFPPVPGDTVAYRCLGTHCELPVTSWEALAANLA